MREGNYMYATTLPYSIPPWFIVYIQARTWHVFVSFCNINPRRACTARVTVLYSKIESTERTISFLVQNFECTGYIRSIV